MIQRRLSISVDGAANIKNAAMSYCLSHDMVFVRCLVHAGNLLLKKVVESDWQHLAEYQDNEINRINKLKKLKRNNIGPLSRKEEAEKKKIFYL